jgi:hypothetical protein
MIAQEFDVIPPKQRKKKSARAGHHKNPSGPSKGSSVPGPIDHTKSDPKLSSPLGEIVNQETTPPRVNKEGAIDLLQIELSPKLEKGHTSDVAGDGEENVRISEVSSTDLSPGGHVRTKSGRSKSDFTKEGLDYQESGDLNGMILLF